MEIIDAAFDLMVEHNVPEITLDIDEERYDEVLKMLAPKKGEDRYFNDYDQLVSRSFIVEKEDKLIIIRTNPR